MFDAWMFVLTIDPCDWMIGVAFGPWDMVIKPIPCVVLQFEWFSK